MEWNRSLEQITGLTKKKVIGLFAWDVQYQLLIDKRKNTKAIASAKKIIKTALRTGEGPLFNQILNAEYRHQDGSNHIAQQKFFPIRVGESYWIGMISLNITETEKLQTEMRTLSRAINQTDSAIVITDLAGTIEFVNPAFTNISGFSIQEAIGQNPSILNSGEMEPDIYKTLWKTITDGNVWEGEFLNRNKSGELYWEYATISPIKNEDGIITHFVGVKENLTERKLADISLRESEEKFRTLAEQSPNMIFITKESRIVYANDKSEEELGYTKDELYSPDFNYHSLTSPEYKDTVIDNYRAHFDGQDIPPIEYSLLTKEGKRKNVILSSKLIRYQGDAAILGTVTDITDRKQVEDLIKRQILQQQALVNCSQTLMVATGTELDNLAVITKALEYLRQGTSTNRAYLFNNFLDPHEGECLGIIAESCAPGIKAHILNPANKKTPWSQVPLALYNSLQSGNAFGGPVKRIFEDSSSMDIFLPPLQSIMTFPVTIEDHFWGFLGFDDCEKLREWDESEIFLLRTASEMIGNAIQRWGEKISLLESHNKLGNRVDKRTAELAETIETLQQEVMNRHLAENKLESRLQCARKLADISMVLMETNDLKEILPSVLKDIGDMLDASQVVLDFVSDQANRAITHYEWSADHIPSLQSKFDFLNNPWIGSQLFNNESVYIPYPEKLPPEANELRLFIKEHKVKSLLFYPIQTDNRLAAILVCRDFVPTNSDPRERLDMVKVLVSNITSEFERESIIDSLEQRVVSQTRELSALYDMTMLASEKIDATDVLEPALERIMDLTGCLDASVHIFSEDMTSLELVSHRGLRTGSDCNLENSTNHFKEWLTGHDEPILEVLSEQFKILPKEIQFNNVKKYLGILMHGQGKVMGILSCYWNSPASLSVSKASLLISMADQIGIIIENQRLRAREKERTILAERQRLARDLHDSVTQSLFSITLYARSGHDALKDQDKDKLNNILQRLETTAGDVLKEMRLLLHQLRPLALEHGGIKEAIEHRFDQIERRVGIKATFECPSPRTKLPSLIEEALHFLITESLNNSLKHAQASEVKVKIQEHQTTYSADITDNGCGFDVTHQKSGMGLNNLEDRVQEIGGSLEINSEPGKGTHIGFVFPSSKE